MNEHNTRTRKPPHRRKSNLYRSRRKLLKSLAAGGGAAVAGKAIPDSWGKPVIDSAVLPAHAKSSPRVDNE